MPIHFAKRQSIGIRLSQMWVPFAVTSRHPHSKQKLLGILLAHLPFSWVMPQMQQNVSPKPTKYQCLTDAVSLYTDLSSSGRWRYYVPRSNPVGQCPQCLPQLEIASIFMMIPTTMMIITTGRKTMTRTNK